MEVSDVYNSSSENNQQNPPEDIQNTVSNTVPPQPPAEHPKKMGKFKASKTLFLQSLHVLRQDKEIVFFPILSSIVSLITLVIFGLIVFLGPFDWVVEEDVSPTFAQEVTLYGLIFFYYLVTYFTVTFFQVGLTAIAYERMRGGDIDFNGGVKAANHIIGKIFVWSVFAATVGIVLKIISDKSKWLEKIAVSLLGAAWNIVTFFIAPTLLLDNVSVWQSIKNSGNTFKKTWGETLITNISLNFFVMLMAIIIFILYILMIILVGNVFEGVFGYFAVTTVLVLSLILLSIISSSLSAIFKVALYLYTRYGIMAEGFSSEIISSAIGKTPETS